MSQLTSAFDHPLARALTRDVFAWLIYLRSHDVRRGRGRRPSHHAIQTAQTWFEATEANTASGRRGFNDALDNPPSRLHFIHFVCEACGLVAALGPFIKPTPRVAEWLRLHDPARAQVLFEAAFSEEQSASLWRALRLPGWKVVNDAFRFDPLLRAATSHAAPGAAPGTVARVLARMVTNMIEPAALDDDPDAQPRTLATALTQYLDWFGLLRRARTPIAHGRSAIPGATLHVEATDERGRHVPQVLPLSSTDWPALFELSQFAALDNLAPEWRFRMTAETAGRAFDDGLSAAAISHLLERLTGDALPIVVARTIRRWERRTREVTIGRVILLETRDPRHLESLVAQRGVRDCLERTLSPRAAVVREDYAARLLARLRRRKISFRARLAVDAAASPLTDRDLWPHAYLAAQIGHWLPDFVPLPYRAPHAVLEALRARLSDRERAAVEQRLAAWQRILAEGPPPAWRGPNPPPESAELTALERRWKARIESAIAQHRTLRLAYRSPLDGAGDDAEADALGREVEPLRIEWHGHTPYLIAYCRRREDERVFRLDRITACEVGAALPRARRIRRRRR